ncbi:MAG: arsenate reductase ArsC [Phycisphaerales bacterium]|nr:arsenate reductase ArsC [Phycisphaerales bacterium]
MAEGWARALLGDRVEAHSAGTRSQGLNRLAVIAMSEVGVDISRHESKAIASLGDIEFDCVITVCDSAREACPVFPGAARVIHQSFDDPPRLALGAKDDDEALPHYRRVRDEIKEFVQRLPHIMEGDLP